MGGWVVHPLRWGWSGWVQGVGNNFGWGPFRLKIWSLKEVGEIFPWRNLGAFAVQCVREAVQALGLPKGGKIFPRRNFPRHNNPRTDYPLPCGACQRGALGNRLQGPPSLALQWTPVSGLGVGWGFAVKVD